MTNEWEKLYQDTILETDWSKIEDRIHAADSAISARLHEFSSTNLISRLQSIGGRSEAPYEAGQCQADNALLAERRKSDSG